MFKSLTVYQLTQATSAVLDRLDNALLSAPFTPCREKEAKSHGFIKPLGEDSEVITYEANGGVLLCLRTDKKLISSSQVKRQVEALRRETEAKNQPFSKTDERMAKEEFTDAQLPGANIDTREFFGYFDRELHMLFLGASDDDADEFIKALGKAFGATAPVKLIEIEKDPCDHYTDWAKDPDLLGDHFELGHQGALKHPNKEGGCGNINATNEDFDSEEFISLIDAGRQVSSISLEHDLFNFRLTSKLAVKNIKLSDRVESEGYDEDAEGVTRANKFAAFVQAMRYVMQDLEPLLGGFVAQKLLDLHDRQPEKDEAVA